jgi:hypothetical protein
MQVLHVEDTPEDAKPVLEKLIEEWPDCSLKVF